MNNRDTIVIFFSKDRAMQLDAAIRSCHVHCESLPSVKKVVIFKTSSKIHADQYKQLQKDHQDFLFVKEEHVPQQIVEQASPFRFISFHCDDNLYIRTLSFSKATQILSKNESVLAHSFRLGKNIKYSYTRNSPEPQPVFLNLDQGVLRFNWAKMKHRGFGYPFEISASVYRCDHILPLLLKCPKGAVVEIENYLSNQRKKYSKSHPFLTCEELPSVISVPVNQVGILPNRKGQNHNHSIESLARKFSENFRIITSQFHDYVSEATHVELEFSFGRGYDERVV